MVTRDLVKINIQFRIPIVYKFSNYENDTLMNTYHKLLIASVLVTCSFVPAWAAGKQNPCLTVDANLMEQKSTNEWNSSLSKPLNESDTALSHINQADSTKNDNSNRIFQNNITVPATTVPVNEGQFVLTAYALDKTCTGKSPQMPGFGITASGTHAKVGVTVAVDPKVIAYGSLIYISGIGWRIAEDTGGAIKGHHIDVLVNSYEEAIRFGVKQHRHVKIYQPETKGGETSATPKEVSLINMQN
jgi:3D (Asp-Asp-Asp) domain-containing protein